VGVVLNSSKDEADSEGEKEDSGVDIRENVSHGQVELEQKIVKLN
jgi:hypothetical protein